VCSSKFSHGNLLRIALAEASTTAAFAAAVGPLSPDTERLRRTRAARAAAAVDLKARCHACRTCINVAPGFRRLDCLKRRMEAAFLAGHAGAQVAACGEEAVGCKVGVWWDGDQEYYYGHVVHYDPIATE
jgi:hypothetical protein